MSRENERLRERAKEIRTQLTNKTTELAKMEGKEGTVVIQGCFFLRYMYLRHLRVIDVLPLLPMYMVDQMAWAYWYM